MDNIKKRPRFKYSAEREPRAWLFLLPALVAIFVFNIVPLFKTFYIAFQKGTLNNLEFNGWENFRIVLNDPKFHKALINTSLYAVVVVPVALIISMLIAVLIHDKIKHKKVFETIFFIPYLTSMIAIGVVFRYLFNYDYGILNYFLSFFNVEPINFLDDPNISIYTVILFGIWMSLAFNIIILLTGLRNIDENFYKVADMFGATKWEQFRRITLPQLVPTITFLLLMNFISAFKVYGQVYAIFNGKPGIAESATTGVFYIFTKFYTQNRYGQGMAAAVILFFIILIFTIIQNKILRRIAR